MPLIDIEPETPDPRTRAVLDALGGTRHGFPDGQRLERGLYLCTHFNFNHYLPGPRDAWDPYWVPPFEVGGVPCESETKWEGVNAYGVCDSPEQFMEDVGKHLDALEDEIVVSFTRLDKADEPPTGGWRWHKWGPYIGKQRRWREYLAEEPEIERVYVYHFFRRNP